VVALERRQVGGAGEALELVVERDAPGAARQRLASGESSRAAPPLRIASVSAT
jgi:hypothetical protein